MKNPNSEIEYFKGIRAGDRKVLAKAITLLESTLASDKYIAEGLMNQILPFSGNSIRVGISGAPGVGKSSLIEVFGSYLTSLGLKTAIIAIDPSSTITHGSILGDKTRMASLANNEKAFIRPSPSKTFLGGINAHTYETILLCEAAGYEVIIIETIGVGQSEIAVKQLTDYFLFLSLAGAGDELQIIKKGIVEMADGVLITKADGENLEKAKAAKKDFQNAIHSFADKEIFIDTFSIYNPQDAASLWSKIKKFIDDAKINNTFGLKRKKQEINWFQENIKIKLLEKYFSESKNLEQIHKLEIEIASGKINIYDAINQLFT